jgi:beta-galactosidase
VATPAPCVTCSASVSRSSSRWPPGAASGSTSYTDGPAAGLPAITRHAYGKGQAFYVSTRLTSEGTAALLASVSEAAGLPPAPDLPPSLEVVERHSDTGAYLIAINHGSSEVVVPGAGVELLTGDVVADGLPVPAGSFRVLRRGN